MANRENSNNIALDRSTGVNIVVAEVAGGWKEPLNTTETGLEAAPEQLRGILENACFIWTDSTKFEQARADREEYQVAAILAGSPGHYQPGVLRCGYPGTDVRQGSLVSNGIGTQPVVPRYTERSDVPCVT